MGAGSISRIERSTRTVTIANGASLSGEVDLGDMLLVGITMPAAWTAADLSYAVATAAGGTFNPATDAAGAELSLTVAASKYVSLAPTSIRGARFMKFRSGTSAVPVNQAAERIVTLHLASDT